LISEQKTLLSECGPVFAEHGLNSGRAGFLGANMEDAFLKQGKLAIMDGIKGTTVKSSPGGQVFAAKLVISCA
jgi:hypothetical protein